LKSFEDFRPGDVLELPAYTVTEEEMLAFARRYDPQYFHTDPEAARSSPFGGLIASGWLTTAVAMRMQCDALMLDSGCLGSPGVDAINWLVPVRPGDTLSGTLEIVESRPSRSKPDRGAVFGKMTLRNQAGATVMTIATRAIYARREQATGTAPGAPQR